MINLGVEKTLDFWEGPLFYQNFTVFWNITECSQKGIEQPSRLALLTNRIAIRHGKKQIYGTQIV